MNEYKVGDKVVILKREGSEFDYPCGFVVGMCEYSGKTAIIKEIHNLGSSKYVERKFYNGDSHYYKLDIDKCSYSWHSSMFKPLRDMNEFYLNNSPGECFNCGVPIFYKGNHDEISHVDAGDLIETYKLQKMNIWISYQKAVPDFFKIFETYEKIIFYSEIFGKMIITKNSSEDYPLLATLEDGDEFELTLDFKYFKDSLTRIL